MDGKEVHSMETENKNPQHHESFRRCRMRHRLRLRIRHAMRLPEANSDAVESIAYECGYANYSHFYRCFLKVNGMSPRPRRSQSRLF